jgi:hypothetical protein
MSGPSRLAASTNVGSRMRRSAGACRGDTEPHINGARNQRGNERSGR